MPGIPAVQVNTQCTGKSAHRHLHKLGSPSAGPLLFPYIIKALTDTLACTLIYVPRQPIVLHPHLHVHQILAFTLI